MRRWWLLHLAFQSVLCRSYVITSGSWTFRGHPIAFEKSVVVDGAGRPLGDDTETSTTSHHSPILLLNGFGVGSFHQHRLINELQSNEAYQGRTIYCIDYLGQGKSWPIDCNDGNGKAEAGLRYCGETWVDQITCFIDQVIQPITKVHLVGNSVGGHLAVFCAVARPDLVASLTLLNATPVWGLNLPGWSGHLPAPLIPKRVGRYLFDRIRDLQTIETYLDNAYVNRNAFDADLMQQIRACTDGAGGHAAFASILWSPPICVAQPDGNLVKSFHDALRAVQCDVLLLFGRDDPWCKPVFAKRMMAQLRQRPTDGLAVPGQRYVEVSMVGHCPNHEAPKAVAQVVSAWVNASVRSSDALSLPCGIVTEDWGETTVVERDCNEIPMTLADRLATSFV